MPLSAGRSRTVEGVILPRLRFGLITDELTISTWQAEALERLGDDVEFVVLNCTHTKSKRYPLAHLLYYALNLASLKSPMTRRAPLPQALRITEVIDFDAEIDGSWQKLPQKVIDAMERAGVRLLVKFGMGLLRVPSDLSCPILSYHHGDPRHFRGRPAGFYELLSRSAAVGQVVQILSNRLDAGQVVAFAETRVHPHSYRATMIEAYRRSPLLLPKAIANCLSGTILPIEPGGRNFRLPGNALVARFAMKSVAAKIRRLLYGLFVERQWEVAEASAGVGTISELASRFPAFEDWRVIERPSRYRFLADPFPHPAGGLLVEALRTSDQQGEIVQITEHGARVLCSSRGHFSYPSVIHADGQCFMVPETAEWMRPSAFRLTDGGAELVGELDVEGRPMLIDPTLFQHGDATYLFANELVEGGGVLRLWVADGLFCRFAEHPASPIRISPSGSRMAGAVVAERSRLLRLGQDCSRDYGNGIILFEIEHLTRTEYSESEVGRLYFDHVKGPHSLNLQNGKVIFDFYREQLSSFAGLRRVQSYRSKRNARAS